MMVLTSDKGVVYHLGVFGAPWPIYKQIPRLLGVSDPPVRIKTFATRL